MSDTPSQETEPGSPVKGPGRIAGIDALRGIALYAMVLYHLVWLLNLFGYTRFELFTDPFWLAARTVILCSFLSISGFVVGLGGPRPRSWARYARRFGILAGAAALVTLGTFWTFPDAYIFFGVLHCLAVSSILVLAFMRLPWWAVAAIALGWLAIPPLPAAPTFDQPWLLWLGLVSRLPVTNDYVPLFPWFGVVLVGLSAGLFARQLNSWPKLAAAIPAPAYLRWPGRHTLPLYLAHPPAILGVLMLAAQVIPPPGAGQDETAAFLNQCMTGCREIEQSVGHCTTYCGCVLTELHGEGLWPAIRTNGISQETQGQLVDIMLGCQPEAQPSTPPLPGLRPAPGQ